MFPQFCLAFSLTIRYAIVNPNGVTCPIPGRSSPEEQYDRVTMLQDMGYRVDIVGQAITNDMLLDASHHHINDFIETDVGIRGKKTIMAKFNVLTCF